MKIKKIWLAMFATFLLAGCCTCWHSKTLDATTVTNTAKTDDKKSAEGSYAMIESGVNAKGWTQTTNQVCPLWQTVKTYTVDDPQAFWIMIQAFGVVTTLVLILRQISLQRVSNSIIALSEIDKEWKSEKMDTARKEICTSYRDSTSIGGLSAERIASFFEKLGLYHELKMFGSGVIWELYSIFVENYWQILEKKIVAIQTGDAKQKGDATAYTHFEKLFKSMTKISKKYDPNADNKSPDDLLKFANEELE